MADRSHTRPVDQPGSDRRARILDRLHSDGRVDVNRVAAEFAVARETVRRDLRQLELDGSLQRVHGGAVIAQPAAAGAASTPEEDVRLGALLWEQLPRSGTMLVGAGRPGCLLAEAIVADPPDRPGLTVITTSLDAAVLLSKIPQLSVYNLGGAVGTTTHAEEGAWPIEELHRLRTDVCLISPDGLDPRGGLTCRSPATAAVAQAQVAAANRMVVLAERCTLGRVALVRFADVREITDLVVPPGYDNPVLAELADLGVHLITAS